MGWTRYLSRDPPANPACHWKAHFSFHWKACYASRTLFRWTRGILSLGQFLLVESNRHSNGAQVSMMRPDTYTIGFE